MNLCAADKPFISVLIATRNRAGKIGETLESMRSQLDCGFAFEVVVVDNGSTDATPRVLEDYSTKLPLVRLHEPEIGKNRALNRALPAARGDLLVFTDDDVVLDPGWLRGYAQAATEHPEFSIFCGPITPVFPDSTPEWIKSHPLTSPAFTQFPPLFVAPLSESGPFPYPVLPFGPNFAVRRSAVGNLLFNPDFGPQGTSYPMGGETEFLKRLSFQNENIYYVSTSSVRHHVEPRQVENDWLRQRAFNYGRGQTRLRLVHGKRTESQNVGSVKFRIFINRILKTLSFIGLSKFHFLCELRLGFLNGKLFEIENFEKIRDDDGRNGR